MRIGYFIISTLLVSTITQFSVARATNWAAALNVHPQTQFSDGYPEILVTPDGTTWVTWMGIDPIEGDEEAYFSRWNGTAWDPASTLNPPNGTDDRFPRFSCSPFGALWATWTSPDLLNAPFYLGLTSHWTGAAWSSPDTVWTDGGRYDYVETQAVSDSEAWFVRDGSGSGGTSDIYVYHRVGTGQDPIQQFILPAADEFLPSVTVGTDGEPWVAWYHVPGPPANPSLSRLQFSRKHLGAWSAPESIAAPVALNRLRIVSGPNGRKWIICGAPDPTIGPFSSAVWALENPGTGWLDPIRISNPIAAFDSSQYQLSVGQTCGGYPRATWLVRDIDIYTRADILTTTYTGTGWTSVERVGQIGDSAYVSWPAMTYASGRTWVAYMHDVPPNFVSNVFTTYSDDLPTAANSLETSSALVDGGVRVSWTLAISTQRSLLSVWRADGLQGRRSPEARLGDAILHREVSLQSGAFIDNSVIPGKPYTYWVEVDLSEATVLYSEATEIVVPDLGRARGLVAIRPNPSRGEVRFDCDGATGERGVVELFDIHGRLVRKVALPAPAPSEGADGSLSVSWNGRTAEGIPLPAGVYFARLGPANTSGTGKAVRFVLIR